MIKLIDPKELNDICLMAIDIGNNGGFCMNFKHEPFLEVCEMPKEHKDRWDMVKYVEPHIIIAEDVHTFAGQGLVSSGTLMQNRGEVIGWSCAIGAKLVWVQPLEWIQCYTLKRKKHFLGKLGKAGQPPKRDHGAWKKHLQEIAQNLVNDIDLPSSLSLKTADALLIWNYWASKLVGKPIKAISLI